MIIKHKLTQIVQLQILMQFKPISLFLFIFKVLAIGHFELETFIGSGIDFAFHFVKALSTASFPYQLLEGGSLVPALFLGHFREEGGTVFLSSNLELYFDPMLAHFPC